MCIRLFGEIPNLPHCHLKVPVLKPLFLGQIWKRHYICKTKGWCGALLLPFFVLWCCRSRARLGWCSFSLTAFVLAVNPGVFLLHQFFQLCLQTRKGRARGFKRAKIIVLSCLSGNNTTRSHRKTEISSAWNQIIPIWKMVQLQNV